MHNCWKVYGIPTHSEVVGEITCHASYLAGTGVYYVKSVIISQLCNSKLQKGTEVWNRLFHMERIFHRLFSPWEEVCETTTSIYVDVAGRRLLATTWRTCLWAPRAPWASSPRPHYVSMAYLKQYVWDVDFMQSLCFGMKMFPVKDYSPKWRFLVVLFTVCK